MKKGGFRYADRVEVGGVITNESTSDLVRLIIEGKAKALGIRTDLGSLTVGVSGGVLLSSSPSPCPVS